MNVRLSHRLDDVSSASPVGVFLSCMSCWSIRVCFVTVSMIILELIADFASSFVCDQSVEILILSGHVVGLAWFDNFVGSKCVEIT